MPSTRCRVVCGLFDVMLMRAPMSALSSVDLPTLGRPTMATQPLRNGGARPGRSASASCGVLIRGRGGGLLSSAAAHAFAGRCDPQRSNPADDFEGLLMRLPLHGDDRILGDRQAPRLEPFLQP